MRYKHNRSREKYFKRRDEFLKNLQRNEKKKYKSEKSVLIFRKVRQNSRIISKNGRNSWNTWEKSKKCYRKIWKKRAVLYERKKALLAL